MVALNERRIAFKYEEAEHRASTARMVFLIVGIITLLVGVGLSRAITRSITIPIFRSSTQIDLMAKGDFSLPVSEHLEKEAGWELCPLHGGDELQVSSRCSRK